MTKADAEPAFDGATILAKAVEIGPVLRKYASAGETGRQLSEPVVDALRSTGVFRMAMPKAWGGPELDICSQIQIIETLSRADGSAGWCAMIGSDSGYYGSNLDDATARSLYPDLDAVTAGRISPSGTLEICDGGYRLSGRWSLASGSTHADVIVGGGRVTENGSPRTTADGAAEWRVAALPASQWQVLDTWNPIGLAGSGSHDYMIAETFVPTANTWVHGRRNRPETLYAWRGMFVVNLVGVPLGVAREACDVAASILEGKVIMPEKIPAKNTPRVQVGIAQARAMVGSARSYVYDTVGTFWATLEAGDEPSFEQRAQLAGCYVHTISACRRAAQLLVDTVGSAAIQKTCPLERHLRDLNTMAQHIQGQVRMWEWAGGMYLGQAPSNPVV